VKGVMWEGFWEEVEGEEGRRVVLEGMRGFVGGVEGELGVYKREVDWGYEIPAFEVV
jgi:hypothetical protein